MDKNQEKTIEAYNNSAKEFSEKIGTLTNYNNTYDFLVNLLHENDNILDLACGPAQISKYIVQKIGVNVTGVDLSNEMLKIAKNNIPNGIFIEDSIITYKANIFYDLIIIGFGIPYLDNEQTIKCIENSISSLKKDGYIYISFMDGNISGFEKTSFGRSNNFYIYYHKQEEIKNILEKSKVETIKEYVIDYKEADGRITKDIILIGEKV
jgi:SAM-dependent methyltransferase